MARTVVIRLPRRLVFTLVPTLLLVLGAEVVQCLSDLKSSARRAAPPYTYYVETASGTSITGRRGSMALVLDPHLIYRQRSNQRLERVTINAQGFRGPDFVKAKAPGAARVVVVGGSVAFGYGASSDAAVWTVPLARDVAAQLSAREVEVLNAGVCGYDSMQERILLETELLDLAPDVVVVIDGYNDMNSSCEVPADKRLAMPSFYELDELHTEATRWWKTLLRLSALYRATERRLKRRANASVPAEHWRLHPDALARYGRNLRAIGRIAGSCGARLVIVAQPEPFGRTKPAPAAEAPALDVNLPGYAEFMRTSYPLFRAEAKEAARSMGAGFVDATPTFDGLTEPMFCDRIHLNDRGNELLAATVAPAVVSALQGP